MTEDSRLAEPRLYGILPLVQHTTPRDLNTNTSNQTYSMQLREIHFIIMHFYVLLKLIKSYFFHQGASFVIYLLEISRLLKVFSYYFQKSNQATLSI